MGLVTVTVLVRPLSDPVVWTSKNSRSPNSAYPAQSMSFVTNRAVRVASRVSLSLTVTEPVVPDVGPGTLPVVQIGLLPAVHVTVMPLSTLNWSESTSARPVADALSRYEPVGAVIERSPNVASPAPAAGSVFESVPAEVVAAGTNARSIVPEYQVTIAGAAPRS